MPLVTAHHAETVVDAAKAGGYAVPAVNVTADLDSFLRPLLPGSRERRRRGRPPLFLSQTFDGSSPSLDEHVAVGAALLAQRAAADVTLEVESGAVKRRLPPPRLGRKPHRSRATAAADVIRVG